MGNEKNGHKPPIALWKPKPEDIIAEADGKVLLFNFGKLFGSKETQEYARFMINKTSYEKQLDQIARYMNFFIAKYDTENELPLEYLRIKFALDKEKQFTIPPDCDEKKRDEIINGFIEFIYSEIFAPDSTHITENIIKMTDDNYLDDIEKNNGRKKHNEREYLESLEFTNAHVKLMLEISMGMKIICPIMFHYFNTNKVKVEKNSDLIYRFYHPLFEIFSHDEYGRPVNMFNKYWVYVKSRVSESASINGTMFEKRQIFGLDVFSVVNSFVKVVIVSENMVKYSYPETWIPSQGKYKENPIGFNKTVIKLQLHFFIKEVYDKNLTEVSNIKNSEGLSGADKMEMNIKKMNEGLCVLADMNADLTCQYIYDKLDIPVTDEEIEYMEAHWKPSEIQIRLIKGYYGRYFGNVRDLNLITRKNFYHLAILLKKCLLIQYGWDERFDNISEFTAIPYILTGNLEGKMNSRIIRNNKYMNKLEEDIHYNYLCDSEYSLLLEIHPDEIKSIISTLINSRFTYVTHENEELTGSDIMYDEDQIGSEITYFLFNQ